MAEVYHQPMQLAWESLLGLWGQASWCGYQWLVSGIVLKLKKTITVSGKGCDMCQVLRIGSRAWPVNKGGMVGTFEESMSNLTAAIQSFRGMVKKGTLRLYCPIVRLSTGRYSKRSPWRYSTFELQE